MRSWDVGIIGGGPGGLLAAYLLQKCANSPVRITLYEASDRFGGKVLTPRFKTMPVRYEAGAAEFYDYSPAGEDPLKELIAELGLSINAVGGSAVILGHRILSNLDDVQEHLGREAWEGVVAFDRIARDWMSPREYYSSDETAAFHASFSGSDFASVLETVRPALARSYIECLIHSDVATEPERTTPSYGLQNYLMNDSKYMRLYSIEGGNQRLVDELEARVQATKKLNQRVTSVVRGGDGKLQVTTAHERATETKSFDFVIVALPINHLPSVEFRGELLAAAMRAHHAHYDHPAHYLRISILFQRAFWRGRLSESYFMLDRFQGCCVYDETSREPEAEHGVLGWLIGGEIAAEMSNLGDDMLIERALESLTELFPETRDQFVEGKVHRWINAVNAIPGGRIPRGMDRRHQPEPSEHPDLFVVGDYMFDSTLNGVLDSAEYVTGWLAARMAEPDFA